MGDSEEAIERALSSVELARTVLEAEDDTQKALLDAIDLLIDAALLLCDVPPEEKTHELMGLLTITISSMKLTRDTMKRKQV